MAESAQEKTQEPTPKRLADARKKGEVPRSKELATLAITAGSVGVVLILGGSLGRSAMSFMRDGLRIERGDLLAGRQMPLALGEALADALIFLVPFLIAGIVFAFAAPLLIGGWNVSLEALTPKLEKLNPLSGIKRIFSAQALMELLKAIAKFVLLGGMAVAVLWAWHEQVLSLSMKPLAAGMQQGLTLCMGTVALLCIGLAAIAAIDAPFQYFSHRKKLRMSMQELKDEIKETEGRPEIKQQQRAMQQQAARGRMAQDMAEASVVINNPTHFSVALKYDPNGDAAPTVVAKGQDHMAELVRDLAKENRIPQLRIAALARALYRHVEVGQEIPAGLYLAVAEVLSYVFALDAGLRANDPTPNPDIPKDYRWQPPQP